MKEYIAFASIVVTAFATAAYSIGYVIDLVRRHKAKLVAFVQVPHGNSSGILEFKTGGVNPQTAETVEKILIRSDGSVEIVKGELTRTYVRFIFWRSKNV